MGILRGVDGEILPPLAMTRTKYLPSLDGKRWGANEADADGIGVELQRVLKRSKLDMKIVLRESDPDTRLELFQRLNTGGTQLSSQELRNCQVLMVSPDALDRLREMSESRHFQEAVALSDRNLEEQYDVELVVRFMVLRCHSTEGLGALGPMLDDEIVKIVRAGDFDWQREREVFERTFSLVNEVLGANAFRKYSRSANRHYGGFVVSLFEILALGLGHVVEQREVTAEEITTVHRELWRDEDVLVQFRGRQAGDRLRTALPMGRVLYGAQ